MSRDNKGREWAKIQQVKPGSVLECDGGFTCMRNGETRTVGRDIHGLFISCTEGHHYLDGQEEEDYYIGLYLAAP